MFKFVFLQRWLLFVGVYLVFLGLFLAFFNQSSLMNLLFNNNINPAFWGSNVSEEIIVKFQSWIYGVLGATITGWGIFLVFIVHYPFRNLELWSWNCILTGIVIWFIVDTAISIHFGVSFNVLFNIVLLFMIGFPLVFSRKYFIKN